MAILFVQHVKSEGPGLFKRLLNERNSPFYTIEIFSDEHFTLPSDCRGIVILGGPMNVDEESKYPFLKEEKEFIRNVLKEEIPLLGICLGAQLIAQVAGGTVLKAKGKEIGWYPVALTEEGQKDSLFQGFPDSLEVFQWHEDTFEVPPQGKRLVTSHSCFNQGFRIGKRCYGIQFHLEADSKMIHHWLNSEAEDQILSTVDSVKQETSEKISNCLRWGRKLLLNYLQIVNQCR